MSQIANTIWGQIPVMTKMAIGARNPKHGSNDELYFNVLRGARTWVEVKLNGLDLYDAKLVKMNNKHELSTIAEFSNVGCEELGEAVYSLTHKKEK